MFSTAFATILPHTGPLSQRIHICCNIWNHIPLHGTPNPYYLYSMKPLINGGIALDDVSMSVDAVRATGVTIACFRSRQHMWVVWRHIQSR